MRIDAEVTGLTIEQRDELQAAINDALTDVNSESWNAEHAMAETPSEELDSQLRF